MFPSHPFALLLTPFLHLLSQISQILLVSPTAKAFSFSLAVYRLADRSYSRDSPWLSQVPFALPLLPWHGLRPRQSLLAYGQKTAIRFCFPGHEPCQPLGLSISGLDTFTCVVPQLLPPLGFLRLGYPRHKQDLDAGLLTSLFQSGFSPATSQRAFLGALMVNFPFLIPCPSTRNYSFLS